MSEAMLLVQCIGPLPVSHAFGVIRRYEAEMKSPMPNSRKPKKGQTKTERVNASESMQASSRQPSAKRLMPMYEPPVLAVPVMC